MGEMFIRGSQWRESNLWIEISSGISPEPEDDIFLKLSDGAIKVGNGKSLKRKGNKITHWMKIPE